MKTTIVLLVSLAAVLAVVNAQDFRAKGESCKEHKECGGDLKCAEKICGCKDGHRPEIESHPQGPDGPAEDVYVCKKVVGTGCNHDNDCSVHLANAKCDEKDRVCVCKSEDGCNGAMSLTVMTAMMAVMVGLLRVW